MAFLNRIAEIQQAVADALQKAGGTLTSSWQQITVRSQTWAYNYLLSRLAPRGYTLAQIQAADITPSWELSLAVWKALSSGAALQAVDEKLLESYDVRKEIDECWGLTSAGAFATPAGTTGQVITGQESPANDIFQWPDQSAGGQDPPGPGLGQGTYW